MIVGWFPGSFDGEAFELNILSTDGLMEKTTQYRMQSDSVFFPEGVCTSMPREVSSRSMLMVKDTVINICCLGIVERDGGG